MPLKYVINMLLRQAFKRLWSMFAVTFFKNKYIDRKNNLDVSISKCQQWLPLDGKIIDRPHHVFLKLNLLG